MANTFTYYDYSKVLSYNSTYNVIVGGRGLGKTFGAKKKAVRDAIRYGHQFVYLRRYKPEIVLSKDTFFADIEYLFPQWEFRTNGHEAQMSTTESHDDKKREWITIGYFLPLVTSQHYKGVAFPKVRTIIFDEFIIETGLIRYLPNETVVFNNFYSTVDRYQDKTRVFFLANSVSITNPYFVDWDINPKHADDNGIVKKDRGFIVCHFPDSKEFNNQAYETVFGRFIKGTAYAEYAVENQFADNHQALIDEKTSHADYMYTLETKAGTFSVWYDPYIREYYCQQKKPKKEMVFTLVPEYMDEGKALVVWRDYPLSALRGAFTRAKVSFDKPLTRNAFLEIFKQ